MYLYPSSANVLANGLDCFKKAHGEDDNKLYFGCELELLLVKDNSSERSICLDLVGKEMGAYAIAKEEYCCNYGFEIVTVPATLKFHKETLWGNFFEGPAKLMKPSLGCGLHIHFSNDALTTKQLAKVIYFVHDKTNHTFLASIAHRNHAESQTNKKTYIKGKEDEIVASESHGNRSSLSLSWRNNYQTSEFRIFKSQNTRQGVMQALEFTAALIEYCGQCEDTDTVLCWTEFLNWFNANNKHTVYPFLRNHLSKLHFKVKSPSILELLMNRKVA